MNDYEPMPHRSSKKTKKWCKGKVGTSHVFETQRYPKNYTRPFADIEVCINCGKHGDMTWDYHKEIQQAVEA